MQSHHSGMRLQIPGRATGGFLRGVAARGILVLIFLYFFLTKAWGVALAAGAFLGRRWCCCGAHGCVPAGMRLCPCPGSAAAGEMPIPPCRGPSWAWRGRSPWFGTHRVLHRQTHPEARSSRRAGGLFGAGVGQGTLGTSLALQGGWMLLFFPPCKAPFLPQGQENGWRGAGCVVVSPMCGHAGRAPSASGLQK